MKNNNNKQSNTLQKNNYFFKSLLIYLIKCYRKRLSGKGIFSCVVCNFRQSESCSEYALRIANSVTKNIIHAFKLIFNRIKLCSSTCIYKSDNGIIWGEFYNKSSNEIESFFKASYETDETKAYLYTCLSFICKQKQMQKTSLRYLNKSKELCSKIQKPIIRDGEKIIPYLRKKFMLKITLICILSVILLITFPFVFAVVPLIIFLFALFKVMRIYNKKKNHFKSLIIANKYSI